MSWRDAFLHPRRDQGTSRPAEYAGPCRRTGEVRRIGTSARRGRGARPSRRSRRDHPRRDGRDGRARRGAGERRGARRSARRHDNPQASPGVSPDALGSGQRRQAQRHVAAKDRAGIRCVPLRPMGAAERGTDRADGPGRTARELPARRAADALPRWPTGSRRRGTRGLPGMAATRRRRRGRMQRRDRNPRTGVGRIFTGQRIPEWRGVFPAAHWRALEGQGRERKRRAVQCWPPEPASSRCCQLCPAAQGRQRDRRTQLRVSGSRFITRRGEEAARLDGCGKRAGGWAHKSARAGWCHSTRRRCPRRRTAVAGPAG